MSGLNRSHFIHYFRSQSLHIVAPAEKQEKVLREIRRPVFSLLDRGPLYDSYSYLLYEAVQEIAAMDHLVHMNHSIIDEYAEFAHEDLG